jgi:hypothetical protein
MQTPTIIFDHINGTVVTSSSTTAIQNQKLAELMAAQRQLAAGGGAGQPNK